MPHTTTDRTEQLASWAADLVGQSKVELRRRPGGGRHEAWEVRGQGGERWFLRADTLPPGPNEHYTLRREAAIYQAVRTIGLPVPEVLGVHPVHEAVLLENVGGQAGFATLAPQAQVAVIEDFAPWLAVLHDADPAELDLSELDLPERDLPRGAPRRSIAAYIDHELDIWRQRLDAISRPNPFLTACLAWLKANNPPVAGRPALVQGDTGPGNFLHDGHRVTAFLDFELAHLGDPMEDLAWVATRNAQEPVPDFGRFVACYTAAGGATPDQARLRYHALFAELRIAILSWERTEAGGGLDGDLGSQLIYGALHHRLTVEAFATVTGTPLPEVVRPPAEDTERTRFFDGALLQLRDVIGPHVDDGFATQRLKGLARVVKYLREVDRVGGADIEAELADLAALLGHRPASVTAGRQRVDELVRAGELTAVDLLPLAAGEAARSHQLLGSAMGVLATRHLPEFGG